MKRLIPLLTSIVVFSALAGVAGAQDTPAEPAHPLLELLALVPDVPAALENVPAVGFVDYAALETARPGVGHFASGAEFQAAREAGDESGQLWMANMQRLIVGLPGLTTATLGNGSNAREVVGFDLFDVDQALTYGVPPTIGNILKGEFDPLAIVEAFEARDYAVTQNEGIVTLQRADGEPANTMDLAGRNVSNPFGGEFGRLEPVVLADGLILNSADETTVQQLSETVAGERRSLLSRPSFVAAAEAVTSSDATLLQAGFLDPRHVAVAPMGMMALELMLEATPDIESLEAMMTPQALRLYGDLPFYTLAVMADLQRGDEQVATLALVYDDEADARRAADELAARLAVFRDTVSRRDEQPLIDMVEGAYVSPGEVYFSESTGKYVAMASVLYPSPDNVRYDMFTDEPAGPESTSTYFRASGRVIRYWMSALSSRAFDVLYVTE